MRLAFQLAYRNLIGAGLRTWLNVLVLSFSFLLIILLNGILDGWNEQARKDSIEWEFGNGQLINEEFDPFDPFTFQDGHGILTENQKGELSPVLFRQGSIYPEGRMLPVVLKGISPKQKLLALPTEKLLQSKASFPILVGENMAENSSLKEGDEFVLRFRDKNGTFDAITVSVAGIFKTNVPTVDRGQIWVSIEKLWEITKLEGHATYYVAGEEYSHSEIPGWRFSSQEVLLKDLNDIIAMKRVSSSIMYILFLAIALLAIFDTQVLSVFRRQKEIGTYIALGMTRPQVVGLFTVEGSMYSIFATIIGSLLGIPLFGYLAKIGIGIPQSNQDFGVAMADRLYPIFGLKLMLITILSVVGAATIVSFLPARKISKMNPVQALKGKLQ